MVKSRITLNPMKIYAENKSKFWISVGLGLFILGVFQMMVTYTQWGENLENSAFDLLIQEEAMRAEEASIVKTDGRSIVSDERIKQVPTVFFIDIDEKTYRKWGEPLLTPRDKLAALIKSAYDKKAKVIVLDVLLEKKDFSNLRGDDTLRTVLTAILCDKNSQSHIIFPVTIGGDGNIRKNLYDDLIDEGKMLAEGKNDRKMRKFHRGIPSISASDSDLLNRYWEIYQPGVNRNGKAEAVWSVPLLAAAIVENKLEELYAIQKNISDGGQKTSENSSYNKKEEEITLGGKIIGIPHFKLLSSGEMNEFKKEDAHSAIYTQRIRFKLIPKSDLMWQTLARTAGTFKLDEPEAKRHNPLPKEVKNNIVLIGNSSPDVGDIHQTPIGTMAGMYIVGNAINTIVSGLQPVHISTPLYLLLEALVIIFAALLFAALDSFYAQIISTVILLAVFAPISWFIFIKWGLFLNFMAPLAGMSFHELGSTLEEKYVSLRKKGQH